MTDYALVLTREYQGREWSLNGDDYSGLTFHDDGPVPSQADLDALWPSVRDAAAWDRVRAERNARLSESDWVVTQATEAGTPVPAEWSEYRQQLRDIPQTFGNPDAVVWPEVP